MRAKTTNKFSAEVRSRAVRMLLDDEDEHRSRWAAISSIVAKICCTAQTLSDWVKKAEIDSSARWHSDRCRRAAEGPGAGEPRASAGQ
jgi:transposase